MNIKSFIKIHRIPLFIIFISLSFRFYYSVTHIAFGQDIARDLLIIENFKDQGKTLIGYGPKASVGNFYLPPFYYQLHYLLSNISNFHPFTMKYFITFVESFTPLILYLILVKYFSKKISLISSVLFIFSVLPTTFGTWAWNPSMIPFTSSLALLLWLNYILNNKPINIIYALLLTTISFQLHYQAFVLFPFCFFVFLWSIKNRKQDFKFWLIGILISLLTLLPYLYQEYLDNFTNTKNILSYFTSEHSKYYDRISKPDYLINFFPKFFDKLLFNKHIFHEIVGRISFYLGMLILSIRTFIEFKNKTKLKKHFWLFLYFISIFIMLRAYKGDKVEYYLSTLFILPFILISLIFNQINKIMNKSLHLCLLFSLIISFFTGLNIAQNTPSNDFLLLKKTFQKINELEVNKARIQFHNDDFINVFAYGLKHFTNIILDKNSLTIIDVCNQKDICTYLPWKFIPYSCLDNIYYTYSSEIKHFANSYQFIREIRGNMPYQISISKVSNIPNINYKLPHNYEYGNDLLLDNIIY